MISEIASYILLFISMVFCIVSMIRLVVNGIHKQHEYLKKNLLPYSERRLMLNGKDLVFFTISFLLFVVALYLTAYITGGEVRVYTKPDVYRAYQFNQDEIKEYYQCDETKEHSR
jgi:hypothetical protein